MADRQIVLDTETTGLEVSEGHRIIEIGCIELRGRRVTGADFHHYVNPGRDSDPDALSVHGITSRFLADKPPFPAIAASLVEYLRGAELLIHNAGFDVGFLNMEFERAGLKDRVEDLCTVTDTLQVARDLHPGQKNSLDALCRRYHVDDSHRELHGALLDARLLADVYLAMTGGQSDLVLERAEVAPRAAHGRLELPEEQGELIVVHARADELAAHRTRLAAIAKKATLIWATDLEAAKG